MQDESLKKFRSAYRRSLDYATEMANEALFKKFIDRVEDIAAEEPEKIETCDVVDVVELGLAVILVRADQGLHDLLTRVPGVDPDEANEALRAAMQEGESDAG